MIIEIWTLKCTKKFTSFSKISGTVLKQFLTYLKSQVRHRWSVEGRKSKGRILTRVSFRYLSGERTLFLLDIDFDAEYQDYIMRTVRKLSELMREGNIVSSGKHDELMKSSEDYKSLYNKQVI